MHRLFLRRIVAAAIVTTLAACGGGDYAADSGSDAAPAAADQEAQRMHALGLPPNYPWLNEKYVIVEVLPGSDKNAVASSLGGKVIDQLGVRPIYLLEVADQAKALAAAKGKVDIVFIEPNRMVGTPERVGAIKNSVSAIGKFGAEKLAPAWAEDRLGLAKLGANRGAGVKVAVLDTGVYLDHPDLAKKLVGGMDFVGQDNTASEERPFAREFKEEDGLVWAWGHGTHVAGVIAKVAPDASIMPVRVLDTNGKGTLWTVAKGVVWAIDPDNDPFTDDGAAVLNLSLGSRDASFVLRKVIEIASCAKDLGTEIYAHSGYAADRTRCVNHEAVVFAGAGNDATSSYALYPAAYSLDGVVSVTASNKDGELAYFASFPSSVRVAAPGEDITSTFADGGYATMSGTSMATPWAAGTAALLVSKAPSLRRCNQEVARLVSAPTNTAALFKTSIRQIDPVAAVSAVAPTHTCS